MSAPEPSATPAGRDIRPHPADDRLDFAAGDPHSLVELVNRVLDRGVVLRGDVTLSVAGVDLVYLSLNALLTSVSTARRILDRPLPGRPAPSAAQLPAPSAAALPSEFPEPADSRVDASPAPGAANDRAGSIDRAAVSVREPAARLADALGEHLTSVTDTLPSRIDVDPDGVQRDLGRLVLTVVELLRQVVEHQAMRRMEDEDLSDEQVERMGLALHRLEEKMRELKGVFGLADEDVNIDLGPLGKLL